MDDHARKKEWVEPRERTIEACDETPRKRKVEITSIVNLACITIPTIGQQTIPCLGLDDTWILNRLPRQLREAFAVCQGTTLLCPETKR